MDKKTHGSLFSGIGGFDLAAEWAGFRNIFQVEKDKYCNKVLEKNFPKAKRYHDINDFSGKKYRGTIDVISGGFPCQPFSLAGVRQGTGDARHLFPQMLRVVSEIKPGWVIGENVYGLLNIEGGVAFENMCIALERLTYEVQTFIIPAAGVNAPHKRDRVWIIAYSDRNRKSILAKRRKEECESENGIIADSDRLRLQKQGTEQQTSGIGQFYEDSSYAESGKSGKQTKRQGRKDIKRGSNKSIKISEVSPNSRCEYGQGKQNERKSQRQNKAGNAVESERPIRRGKVRISSDADCRRQQGGGAKYNCKGQDRLLHREIPGWEQDWLEVATGFCSVDDGLSVKMGEFKLSKSRHRIKQLEGYGNAIVPQVAYQIFKAINETEEALIKQLFHN